MLTFGGDARHTDVNHDNEIDTREQLTRLWLEVEPSVQAYVFSVVTGFQDAEDVLQQVALTVARRFEEYDSNRPFVAWALWLAKSRIADFHRKRGRERLVFSESLMDQLAAALVQRQPERSARQVAMEQCVEKLPEKSRQLLELRYEEDASMDRVAEVFASTEGAVRVMLFRIRNLLAECIQAEITKEAQ